MKCPYCGVHYEDTEKQCPVCGKRSGITTPKKPSKFTSAETSAKPAQASAKPFEPSSTSSKKTVSAGSSKSGSTSRAAKSSYSSKSSEEAWQRAMNQTSAVKKKKSGCGIYILIGVVLTILLCLLTVFFALYVYDNASSGSGTILSEDSTYSSCEILETLPTGTWQTQDKSLTVVIDEEGCISWTDGVDTAEDYAPLFYHMFYTEDNFADYCTDYEMSHYPLDEYTHYNLYFADFSSDVPDYDLYIYLPNGTARDDITSFDCYDWEEENWFTLFLVDESTTLPETLS